MGETLQLLTNSRRTCFLSCPRKHYFMYELGRRPVSESRALVFGTMFHRALELWWLGAAGNVDGVIELVIGAKDTSEPDHYMVAQLRALLDGYHAAYAKDRANYSEVAAEQGYIAPLINPETGKESRTWQLAGKIDAVAVIDGKQIIIEHKTTSDSVAPESDYWPRLSIDGQVSGYIAGAPAIGANPAYCLYDVIHKPAIKPHKATPEDKRTYNKNGDLSAKCRAEDETPYEYYTRLKEDVLSRLDYYFARREIVRMDDDLAEYMGDMWATGQMIRECQLANRWPKNVNACTSYGTCSYFSVCTKCASIKDDSLFVTIDNPNPELGGV